MADLRVALMSIWEACDGLWFAEATPRPPMGWYPPFVSLDFDDCAVTLTVDDALKFAAFIVSAANEAATLSPQATEETP